MPITLKPIDKEKYIETEGNVCPFCGSRHLGYGDIHDGFNFNPWKRTHCWDCNRIWKEKFKLVEIEEVVVA